MKKGFFVHLEQETSKNSDYRRVLYTGKHLQLVLMMLRVGEEIGVEVHQTHDQFIRVEEGVAMVSVNESIYTLKDGDAVIIPAGAQHNVVNTGSGILKLYTLYAPPEHKDGALQKTKADEREEYFDGITSEL